jgi:uncharacterized membrane protein YkoI
MMMTPLQIKALLAFSLVATSLAFTYRASAFSGEELAKEAKISIQEARVIALKAHPGRISAEELEKEAGGSGLRYTFEIESGKKTQEVGVDAKTGRVLENVPD